MPSVTTLGLSKIEVGAVAVDGGMGTTLAALGLTYQDTCKLVEDDASVQEYNCEEYDDPVVIAKRRGKLTLNFSVMDADPDTLMTIFGGTVTGTAPAKTWVAPNVMPASEKSIKVTPRSGMSISLPRCDMRAKINSEFSSKGIFLVEVTAAVLQPTKTGVGRISSTQM